MTDERKTQKAETAEQRKTRHDRNAAEIMATLGSSADDDEAPKAEGGTAAPISQESRDRYFQFQQDAADRKDARDYWETKYRSAEDRDARAEITREREAAEAPELLEPDTDARSRAERDVADIMAALAGGRGRGGPSR